jgi:hypothetical protein
MFERHIKVFKELGFTVDLSQPDFLKSNFEPRNSSGNWRKNQKLIGIAPLHNTILKCILGSNAGSDRSIGFRYNQYHSAFAVEQKKLKFWIRLLLIKKTSSIWRETQT